MTGRSLAVLDIMSVATGASTLRTWPASEGPSMYIWLCDRLQRSDINYPGNTSLGRGIWHQEDGHVLR